VLARIEGLGELLASGRTADVYAVGVHEVVKLSRPWVSPSEIELERQKASISFSLGIPTPAVGCLVSFTGRAGLIFERIEGMSMMEHILRQPDLIQALACQLADLHWALHQNLSPDSMPKQNVILSQRISRCALLSQRERELLLGSLAQLPTGKALCHGDFHPGNVIMADRGPVVIDWIDASCGNPIADVARTSLLFLGHIATAPASVRPTMELYHQTYLNQYMRRAPDRWIQHRKWLPILAAARLSEGIMEQQEWLLEQARIKITNDSLG
jgi:uncharacterized protein (TIGR02172 family)